MAKHFRDDVEKTSVAPRRQEATRRRYADQADVSLGGGQARGYVPAGSVRRDDYYIEEEPEVRGGFRAVFRGFFLLLAWAVRLCALGLFVVVMLNAMPVPAIRHYVAYATELVTSLLPWGRILTLAVDTPFGGTFRCDLCILSLVLFVLDWLLCRIRAAIV